MVSIAPRALYTPQSPRREYAGYIRLTIGVWLVVFIVGFLIAIGSSNSLLTFACITVVPIMAVLVWRIGEPPVVFAALFAQWLQVSVGAFRATADGVTLENLFGTPGASYATWLSLGGLLILAFGIRLANLNRRPMDIEALRNELRTFRYSRIVVAYIIAQSTNLSLQGIIWLVPGLSQALLAATQLRWLFYFLLVVTTLVQKRSYTYLVMATAFEIGLGFTSFFSDFRYVFFVLAVSYLTVQTRMTARMVSTLGGLFCVLLFLAVIWSAVKNDYRVYQNQGSGAQYSTFGTFDKLDALGQLVSQIDSRRFLLGFDALAQRVEYTRFFGFVTENVPGYLPYDDGEIWGEAIYHVVTPRLFYPDKAELRADIFNTIRYTGLQFAGGVGDTEIPLGYMAESYIDFGPILMFVPVFLLGLLLGYEYRFFATRRTGLVFSYGLTAVVFILSTSFEETAAKILGGNLTIFIVSWLAWRFAVPVIQPWLVGYRRPVVWSH